MDCSPWASCGCLVPPASSPHGGTAARATFRPVRPPTTGRRVRWAETPDDSPRCTGRTPRSVAARLPVVRAPETRASNRERAGPRRRRRAHAESDVFEGSLRVLLVGPVAKGRGLGERDEELLDLVVRGLPGLCEPIERTKVFGRLLTHVGVAKPLGRIAARTRVAVCDGL